MSWTGAIVVFAVMWWIIFIVIIPRGAPTQAEANAVEPGTPPGAPAQVNTARKALWATLASAVALAAIALVLEAEVFSMEDFNFLYPESFARVQ